MDLLRMAQAALRAAAKTIFAVSTLILAMGVTAHAESPAYDHAIAMHGEPACRRGFTHLPYADPKPPRAGASSLASRAPSTA
jgi:peptide/nickel transport system substrate-binding protein